MKRFLIGGNWKMHKGPKETRLFFHALKKQIKQAPAGVEALVCPPAISITSAMQTVEDTGIKVGAQNVYFRDNGAYTGEISTAMVKEAGCSHVIVGHSERREYFGETNADVNAKTQKVLSADLKPIICVGESLHERKKKIHKKMVSKQIMAALQGVGKDAAPQLIFAYEPLWAIGTGDTAKPEQAGEMHALIREKIAELYDNPIAEETLILYGGSMKPKNAESLLKQPDLNGGLIGGASLKADSFAKIIKIAGDIFQKT